MSFSKFAKTILISGVVLCVVSTLPVDAQYNNYNQNNQNNTNYQGNNNQFGNTGQFGNSGTQERASRSRSSRSRTNTSTANQTQGNASKSGSTTNKPPTNLLKPAASTSKPAASSASRGQGRIYTSSSKSLKVPKPTISLYLSSDDQIGVVNEPKVIKVLMANKTQMKFDRISAVIKYNPDDLIISTGKDASGSLVKADSLSLAPNSALDVKDATGRRAKRENKSKNDSILSANVRNLEIVENTIDVENGLIYLDIKTKKDSISWNGLIAEFTCIPVHETRTNLSFLFINPEKRDAAKEPLTSVSLLEKDQLGTRFSAADGVINMDISIFESREKAKRSSTITKMDSTDDSDEDITEAASLVLIPREKQVNVGDIMEIDVCLKNPGKVVFDSIGLLLAYNTRVFEPLDGENAVSGINIQDKKYKSSFSMDFPLMNIIDEEKGIIDYRKKAMRKPVRSEGIFATLRLRAIKPTKKTTFRMFISSKGEEPTTGVYYRTTDRLGDPSDPFDGVETCSVGVSPTTAYLSKLN